MKDCNHINLFSSSPPAPLLSRGEGGRRPGEESKKIKLAKTLRKNSTPHEQKLWQYLRAKRFNNLKFRRQHPIGPYIVDFYCAKKKLVIELDGGGHSGYKQTIYDQKRDSYLEKGGLSVIRIWNNELTESIDGTLETIAELCGST